MNAALRRNSVAGSSVLLVDPHLPTAQAPAPPADDGRIGRAVGAEAGALLAERRLRPLVIARKISFGSQSDAGARTREILMSVLQTLRLRTDDPPSALKSCLDHLAFHPHARPFPLLFGKPRPPTRN
jgi:hypothetical protein